MITFQEKNRWSRIIRSKITIIFLLLVLIFVVNSVFNIYGKYRKSLDGANLARTELENLKDRQITLENKINSLKQSSGIEAEVRDKFAVIKEGEKTIILVEGDNIVQDNKTEEKVWWQKFLDLWSE